MSNIVSFDYRRKSLGELQREVEVLRAAIARLQEWIDWQEMISDTQEVELAELRSSINFLMAQQVKLLK